ncbi:MAG: tryptophan synthase subunit alpha [Gemmatimonadaceae bacterium]|nr:tryptophan synthase subunit alpha [Gemmatimonadaceae bacterium]
MESISTITSSRRLSTKFEELSAEGRKALVCYLTAGFPDRGRSIESLRLVAQAGADVIEIGIPFSDPIADGPVIQASSQRALEQGIGFKATLQLVHAANLEIPVVLFTYLNPLISAGPDALDRAAAAGVSGVLITDLPVGADSRLEDWLGKSELDFVRLVAPTTPKKRMQEIARNGGGFVYLISRLGVTGMRNDVPVDLKGSVDMLRSCTDLPICIGFGVSTPEQAREVSALADGVVVGSALVQAAERSPAEAGQLVAAMRRAMDA